MIVVSALRNGILAIDCFIRRVKKECNLQVHVEVHAGYDTGKTYVIIKIPFGCRPRHLKCIQDILEHHMIQLKSIEAGPDRDLILYCIVK